MPIEGPIDNYLSDQCGSLQLELQKPNLDKEQARALWDHFVNFYSYSDHLGFLIDDSRRLSSECGSRYQRFFAKERGSLNEEDNKEFSEIRQLFHRLLLVSESFIIFSKIFLDRLADAFLWFSGESRYERGSSHNYLFGKQAKFLEIAARLALNSPEEVAERGSRLVMRVISARNDLIEHTHGQAMWSGPLIQGGRAFAVPGRIDAKTFAPPPIFDFERLLLDLRDYSAAYLRFVMANVETVSQIVHRPCSSALE